MFKFTESVGQITESYEGATIQDVLDLRAAVQRSNEPRTDAITEGYHAADGDKQ